MVCFKEAAEAFEVIGHAEKRARFTTDTAMPDWKGAARRTSTTSPTSSARSAIFSAKGCSATFSAAGRRGGSRIQQGADIRCEVQLDLSEAAFGTSKVVNFQRHAACETCHGSGAKPGTSPETCRYCGGRGRIVQSTGIFQMQSTCPSWPRAGESDFQPMRRVPRLGIREGKRLPAKLTSRRASITARGSACKARASRVPTAGRPAIAIASSTSPNIHSSTAEGKT